MPKEAAATAAPNTVRTTVMTHALAAITDRRAGTAVNVVRMRPVLNSPVIARAPMALARIIMATPALVLKASWSGIPWAMKLAGVTLFWCQYS
jgi:hypothetical protein